ncbi:red chlorophyll catabolite reductase, chloroplastic-like [Dorcoceras hygrometricum]|uniref:Red chlorophyll catabolite reductase, chloroplastic-like n=1 Tax=Dorcoceras hygrometricum TaxID=472368 RepID=A0A2Z7AV95_9LAMI|nr:red chlorophyll catabolite reductase, chloroplastic-like [Dorcoceras hygrometricum]
MSSGNELKAKFLEFPYVSVPHRDLMVDLVSSVESRAGSSLQPCTLPHEVQHFSNSTASSRGSLHIRTGTSSSQIDFMLGAWIHCKLPSGGALNITSLSAYLRPSTDAPHFLMELIQSSPTSLVLILDLTPRKDLIAYPDYLKTYYEDPQLDKHRQRLQMLPQVSPYFSPSLYIRAVVSPTAIMVSIDMGESESASIEGIIQDHISPIAKELLEFWLDKCAFLEKSVGDLEKVSLAKRDGIIKNKTIEIDLASSFPRLFGQEVANRVLDVLKGYYNA